MVGRHRKTVAPVYRDGRLFISGLDYLVTLHGDATYSIPGGSDLMDFVAKLADEPDAMYAEQRAEIIEALYRESGAAEGDTLDLLRTRFTTVSNTWLISFTRPGIAVSGQTV